MTMPSSADVTVVTSGSSDHHSYVDWPAIIAGIVIASAISVLLLTFGSAIGLSLADFDARDGASPVFIAIVAALWLLLVQVSSFMAGGYVSGRMRRRAGDATPHEVDVRDGMHGLLVWAGAVVLGVFLASSGLTNLMNTVGSVASTATEAASNVAGGVAGEAAEALDPNAYFVDTLFRAPAQAGGAAAPATPAAEPAPAAGATPPADAAAPATPAAVTTTAPTTASTPAANRDMEALRGEASRILLNSVTSGEVPEQDRTYLAQLVAQNTEMSPEEAQARVDEVLTNVQQARDQATQAAETARKTAVLAAFLIAAALLVSAVAAYWAAHKGGQHRDEGTLFEGVFRRF